jgi:Protein kinase domain/FHA domain
MSPYVVRVLDVGKLEGGERYLVTEAVLGRGLDAAITYGPAPARSAAMWTAEVLAALTEAHSRGVLHRDVKPENVLLAPTPGHPVGEMAKLTDFGLAKVLDAELEGSVMLRTAQGAVMGTADYMSPEQWQGGPVDPRSDLYSVGAMFYELLSGRAPFEAATLRELAMAHMLSAPRPLDDDLPAEARAFEAILRRALAKRPTERFQGADEMRDAIERVGGFRLAMPTIHEAASDAPISRAELVTDAGVGPVQIVAGTRVVLGRTGHVVPRCVPFTVENDRRGRTISRRHARIEWRGGGALLFDLQSSTGTSLSGRAVDHASGTALRHGDEIALGPHITMRFEHAPSTPGVLPRWARLTRTDAYGSGLVHLLVLTSADVSSAPDAAVTLPSSLVGVQRLEIAPTAQGFTCTHSQGTTSEVRDGTSMKVGLVTVSFAVELAVGG